MKEIKLESGAILKIGNIPFVESKALYQSVLEEMKDIKFENAAELTDVLKNLVCAGFSSKKIESALQIVMKRCLYNGLKIDDSTFEPEEARSDYSIVCIEIVENAIRPFMNGLSVGLKRISQMFIKNPI